MPGQILANPLLWAWAAIAAVSLWLVWLLSPILAPFLFAGILAYVLNPIVERLAGRRMRRTFAVLLVISLALLAIVSIALVVVPLFYKELRMLADRFPAFLVWINQTVAPWLEDRFQISFQLDVATVKQLAGRVFADNDGLVPQILASLRIGGLAFIAFLANMLLVPVVLFYLLRDWGMLISRAEALVPRRLHERVRTIVMEIDQVLAEFLRGQLLVVIAMTVYFVTALWFTGLDFALPIGIITGMLVFIPYVGAFTGFLLGTVAAVLQFGTISGVLWVWLAFFVGQTIEGFVVTPSLVGERIGLHPVAVIFALLAFGQVFGFFGVLLALPASAALLVGLRHVRKAYLNSSLYA
ncbi:MAG: AI-2E family transporter [Burkholderiales bacterium]